MASFRATTDQRIFTLWMAFSPSVDLDLLLKMFFEIVEEISDTDRNLVHPLELIDRSVIHFSDQSSLPYLRDQQEGFAQKLSAEGVTYFRNGRTTVFLGSELQPERPIRISSSVIYNEHSKNPLYSSLCDLAKNWSETMDADSTFVTNTEQMSAGGMFATSYERTHNLLAPLFRKETMRFIRGIFPGMFISRLHCTHLGGKEAVLNTIPAFQVEDYGGGIWIDATGSIDIDHPQYVSLEHYFQGVLGDSALRQRVRQEIIENKN